MLVVSLVLAAEAVSVDDDLEIFKVVAPLGVVGNGFLGMRRPSAFCP